MNIKNKVVGNIDTKLKIQRIIGDVKGSKGTPTVIFFGGIHGNELAGVKALQKVYTVMVEKEIPLVGNFYAISGNIQAIEKNERFVDVDLNRIWTKDALANTTNTNFTEYNERTSIYKVIKEIVAIEAGPFYFIDLHTTSSETNPFITISDSLNNRKFSNVFAMPTVLGIEEYLEGPLLTFINEFGHVALGFEAGQHYNETSIDNCVAFIWLALEASGCIAKSEIEKYDFHKHYLSFFNDVQDFYEIKYKYQIGKQERFAMLDGFTNFETITKHQKLAISNGSIVGSPMEGKIFMPLYQQQGDDGFFIITRIPRFWLYLSILVRTLKLYHVLRILPGIKQDNRDTYTLIVNPKTARFLTTQIFHLFGFRKKSIQNNRWYFTRRDRKINAFI
ncbi:MAG: succinylglutamate desuccinylase/aspartoacylase family protein [Flavobacteriaceae bacterium]|nr:succinylglutamate desuccinylase/aspartoacylase family protein [Flavobacteriaceae bacterium]